MKYSYGGDDMRQKYVPPELETIAFKLTDVIMTSSSVTLNDITDPTDPALDDYETLPKK
ncbi:MAG: hypothetical protein MJ100_09745 [Ruminococcus sp.]|nr:hypothetical protein [Ruminococcus sp.]